MKVLLDLVVYGSFRFPSIGVRGWVNKLEWSGAALYKMAKEKTWSVPHSKEIAGEVRNALNFTFATIRGAGHLGEPSRSQGSKATITDKWKIAAVPLNVRSVASTYACFTFG